MFLKDAAGNGSFDFTVPHRIGAAEFGYNSRLIYETVMMPPPDVIVESSGTPAEFPDCKPIFRSSSGYYSVLFSGRTAVLPVKRREPAGKGIDSLNKAASDEAGRAEVRK